MKKSLFNKMWAFSRFKMQKASREVGIRGWIEEKRWLEDASMQEVADRIGISRNSLSNYFILNTGKPFLRWRKEMRIEEAKKLLLKEKDLPTGIIGEAVGINDKSNFKRQFREVTGYTPAQWRLKHQGHISRQ